MAATAHRPRGVRPTLLRARLALPMGTAPITDAALVIHRDRLVAVGPWRRVRREHLGPVLDLGERLLLPGLLNAHCHLDYTKMAGLFPPPRRFVDWIKSITVTKQSWSDDEFRESWLAGAGMLLRHGTTLVGDVEAIPALLPGVWRQTPLRVFSFLEMTGIRSRREPQTILEETLRSIAHLPRGRCRAMLSPHAPYSTKPDLLRLSAQVTGERRWLMTTHVAESVEELDMFLHRRGEMFEWLQRNERDMTDCGATSPVQHLERSGALSRRLLAIHVNHLEPGDAGRLARHGASVVHCPRSHAYFRHHPFPYRRLNRAGVNVCLGTDSLASVMQSRHKPTELDLFAEMREFATHHPQVSPVGVLRMTTLNAALALGLAGRAGQLTPGALADLIALPFSGPTRDAASAALAHEGPVEASMIGGRWAMTPREQQACPSP
jgi:cytosine/adenosine deaminase-related metal-dependent hydrolase